MPDDPSAHDFIDTTKPYVAEPRVTPQEIAEIARQAVEDVTRTATSGVAAAIDAVQPALVEATKKARDAGNTGNPIAIAIVSFAIGVGVGLVLPIGRSRQDPPGDDASDA